MSQPSFLVRLASLFFSLVLITPNAIPALRSGHRAQQSVAVTPVTLPAALATLSPNVTITDVTLSGSIRRIAGSDDDSGNAILKALSTGSARADLSFASGTISEISNSSPSGVAGVWSGTDGVSHAIAFHNLLAEPAWFFPTFAISRRLSGAYVVTDLGPETRSDRQVEHISVSQATPANSPAGTPSLQHLTQVDFFLDSQTLLPASISFNVHPDNNALLDIPVEIGFSDYHPVSGVQIPFHIQKFLNRSLLLDFQVQNAAINSGLSISEFAVQ